MKKKMCPSGKIYNPKTKRCVNRDGKVGKTLLETMSKGKKGSSTCPSDKIYNPKTKRCVNRDGKIGKTLLGIQNECSKGKIRNPATGRCVNKNGRIGKRIIEEKKPEGSKFPILLKVPSINNLNLFLISRYEKSVNTNTSYLEAHFAQEMAHALKPSMSNSEVIKMRAIDNEYKKKHHANEDFFQVNKSGPRYHFKDLEYKEVTLKDNRRTVRLEVEEETFQKLKEDIKRYIARLKK